MEAANRALKRLQRRIQDEELRDFIGDQDVDEADILQRPIGRQAGLISSPGKQGYVAGRVHDALAALQVFEESTVHMDYSV